LQQAISRKTRSINYICSIPSNLFRKNSHLKDIETNRLFSPQKAKENFFFTLLQRNSQYASVKKSQDKTVIQSDFKGLKEEIGRQMLVLKALTEQFKMMKEKLQLLLLIIVMY